MSYAGLLQLKHCRWCGKQYYAHKPKNKDGFCKPSHKQAHYRAYKKWVTVVRAAAADPRGCQVTHKKRKKSV